MNCKHCGSSRIVKDGKQKKPSGIMQKYICRDCNRYTIVPLDQSVKQAEPQNTLGITEETLRKKHDKTTKIRDTAESLQGDLYLEEHEFIRKCNITGPYRANLDRSEFDKFRGKVDGKIYYSHPDNIKRLKNEGVLT